MILLIDNYDSFSYNLYQCIGEITEEIKVIRNDELPIEEIRKLKPTHIVLSPGPGRPEKAGNIIEVIKELGREIPILGVCLGHQAICQSFGAEVIYARELMHGKQSRVIFDTSCPIFNNCTEVAAVARYHSLIVDKKTLSDELRIVAITEDKEIMAVQHKKYPIFGVQFHPESFLTQNGAYILRNFITLH